MKPPTSRKETTMSKSNYSDMVALLEWASKQKKEKKSGPKIGALHIAMILMASFPIIAPLYTWWIRSILAW